MSHPRLDTLREKLLRAGMAPRHVRAYLGELSQHFDDLMRAEVSSGQSNEAAFTRACARLGSEDELTAAMLARPELRSISARFPWAVFGIAPAILLALLIVAAVFAQIGVVKISEYGAHLSMRDWGAGGRSLIAAWNWAMMYVFPPAIAAAIFGFGARRFIGLRWLALGALLVAILGAMDTVATLISNVPHESAFSVGFGFSSDKTPPRILLNMIPVCMMSAVYWLWQRRKSAAVN